MIGLLQEKALVLPSFWIGKNDKHKVAKCGAIILGQIWAPVTAHCASKALGCGEDRHQLPPGRIQSDELVAIGRVKKLVKAK